MSEFCHACAMSSDGAPRREAFLRTHHWRIGLDFNSRLEGWLIVAPLRHVESLAALTPDEAAELGPLLREASVALEAVTGCVKTYVMLFAEADGFAHVHVHVVPRLPDHPAELRGPRVFGYHDGEPVAESRRDELAELLAAAWPS